MGKTYLNAYDQFSQVLNTKTDDYFDEVKKICEANSVKVDFYELCKYIVDIGLNIKKTKDNHVQALFSDTDINITKNKAIEFIAIYVIKDFDKFLRAVEEIYPYATELEDERETSAVIFDKKETSKWNSPSVGSYYSFTQLPNDIWIK